MMDKLRVPTHPRFRPKTPPTFSSLKVSSEQKVFVESQALDIFTEAANSGRPFSECLAAILITGMDIGRSCCDCQNQKAALAQGVDDGLTR
jgi:hypothetical protein